MNRPTQVERWGRRERLLVLLSRAERGVLLPSERPLLRAAVEAELAAAEEAHAEADRYAAVIRRIEQMADRWESGLPDMISNGAVVDAIRTTTERAGLPARAAAPDPTPKETRRA